MDFAALPQPYNADGKPRRAGFELELASIELLKTAEIIQSLFGGEIDQPYSLEASVHTHELGSFRVELDSGFFKRLAKELENDDAALLREYVDTSEFRRTLSRAVEDFAGELVPYEIVTPPLTPEQWPVLDRLVHALREHHAQGTRAAFTNAFGLHMNVEIASTDPAYLLRIIKAFLLLYPWLKRIMDIDPSRRLLTFIDPFPEAYGKYIFQPDYDPSMDQLIEDYLYYNPTRNRGLDMLPIFVYLEPGCKWLMDEETRELVKPRPAFHYRLPNCEIDDPNWSIARDWNYWVEIEKLAQDADKLALMSNDYLKYLNQWLHRLSNSWVERLGQQYGYTLTQA